MELCLGTVQFGLNYGLLDQKKPSLSYSVDCLDYATQNGISALDTAEAYGTAQEVVGAFLKKKTIPRDKLFISSKMLPNVLDECKPNEYESMIRSHLETSLRALHTDYLDAYLFHSARYVYRPELLDALAEMKSAGLTRKVGVSVYEPDEAIAGYHNSNVDFMQMPYSVFDHRMKNAGIFDKNYRDTCRVHTRSAFIQGLILMDEDQVPDFLQEAKPILSKLKRVARETGISRVALAIAYVKRETAVSHLVFGVDSKEQLQEDIHLFGQTVDESIMRQLDREFADIKAEVVMPSLWKR